MKRKRNEIFFFLALTFRFLSCVRYFASYIIKITFILGWLLNVILMRFWSIVFLAPQVRMKSFRINIINLLNFSFFQLNYSFNVLLLFSNAELSGRIRIGSIGSNVDMISFRYKFSMFVWSWKTSLNFSEICIAWRCSKQEKYSVTWSSTLSGNFLEAYLIFNTAFPESFFSNLKFYYSDRKEWKLFLHLSLSTGLDTDKKANE